MVGQFNRLPAPTLRLWEELLYDRGRNYFAITVAIVDLGRRSDGIEHRAKGSLDFGYLTWRNAPNVSVISAGDWLLGVLALFGVYWRGWAPA